jgi:lipopolysaccharide export system ATP-binding protein
VNSYLKAINIHKSYRTKSVLKGVSLEVALGEVVGLLGPNGAGKTTFFYNLVGLVGSDSGQVIFKDQDITDYPMYLRGRLGIGYLAQESSIFRDMSVADNIMAILELKYNSFDKRKQRLDDLLAEFSLSKLRNYNANSLSGGERRRVEIARCLAGDPKVILLDEPFAGVDPIAVNDIRSLIKQLTKLDIGVIITDHNVKETLEIIDRAYIMYDGKIIVSGSADEIVNNSEVKKIYLGENFLLSKKTYDSL